MRRRRGARRFALWICCLCTACLATAAGSTRRDFRSADSSDSTDTYLSLSWDSSPFNLESVTDNNLGLLAKSCSEQFCHAGINGLDLWISLEEVCTASAQPYMTTLLLGEEPEETDGGDTSDDSSFWVGWHPVTAGILCGLVAAGSLVAGYKLGSRAVAYHKDIGRGWPLGPSC